MMYAFVSSSKAKEVGNMSLRSLDDILVLLPLLLDERPIASDIL